ncbi:MAG TPA: helix-turn-helix transcriptional regulator [Phycisphaerae bacterium]|nr:helix-turn-helix transcriptional regulator [Phycisphaerae bacterium]
MPLDKAARACYYCIVMAKKTDIEDQLRQAILQAGMSRYALWKLSGVTEAVLSRFVNRSRTIRLDTAAKLAEVLGLELTPKRRARKGK